MADEREAWTRLAPGVYDDGAGGLHFVVPEFLDGNGYADTEANRSVLLEAIREAFGEVVIHEQEN